MTAETAASLKAMLEGRVGSSERSQILELLRPLAGEQFAQVVQAVDLRRLMKALDWRSWGSNSRAELMTLLERQVASLSIESKILLANLLAEGPTTFREEKVLRALFLSERGAALTALKLGIDTSTAGHDLLSLLTSDIDAPELRFDILRHFRDAAEVPKDPRQRPLRVVSDIDDTLYSSLKDPRHPRGSLYKGVLELFAALSSLPPVFLTARPELIAALFERLTHRQLRGYGLEKPTVLSGTLRGLFGHRRMAEQKARTMHSYTEMYPEFRFLFFGDSGQGDTALAESLLSVDEPVIERAFIHKISDNHAGSRTTNGRIHHFSDYAEAAERLHEMGYLQEDIRDSVTSLVRATP